MDDCSIDRAIQAKCMCLHIKVYSVLGVVLCCHSIRHIHIIVLCLQIKLTGQKFNLIVFIFVQNMCLIIS